jgi:hypothetical protein
MDSVTLTFVDPTLLSARELQMTGPVKPYNPMFAPPLSLDPTVST